MDPAMIPRGTKNGDRVQIAARFDKSIWDRIITQCLRKNVSVATLIRTAVSEYLKREEKK